MSPEFRAARAAFLGIERSLTGRRWAARLADERMALAMAQRHGMPDAICRLLAAREVDLEGVPDFLEPTLRKFLPDPSHLKDMDAAIARVVRAVREGEKIVVFGDYDVDGATSSALLARHPSTQDSSEVLQSLTEFTSRVVWRKASRVNAPCTLLRPSKVEVAPTMRGKSRSFLAKRSPRLLSS